MDDKHEAPAAPERAIGAVVLCVALGALAALAFASRRVMLLDRAVDAGDVLVLCVLGAFATFCALLGWRLLRTPSRPMPPVAAPAETAPAKRVTVSHGCAAAGVLLLVLSVLVPAHWYPVVFLFSGLALLAISHGLTPCVERLEQLRKARASERQL
jgi:hypothetical protein